MNRFLALIGALFFAFRSVSSACAAAPARWVPFTLDQQRGGDECIQSTPRGGLTAPAFVLADPIRFVLP